MKFIIFALIPLILSLGIVPAFAAHHEVMSPYQQIKNGVAAEEVECKDLLKLMIRSNGNPACVNKKNIPSFESKDWTLRLTTDINEIDGTSWHEPQNRNLGFRNVEKLVPFPQEITRGSGTVHEFGSNPIDLSKVMIQYFDKEITIPEYLQKSHTDGILVLKGNDIVYEKYLRMEPNERHALFSVSKTMMSSVLGNYVIDGSVDLSKPIKETVSDIGSGYADATFQQVLDMDVSNSFDSNFHDLNSDAYKYEISAGWKPDLENKWQDGIKGYIQTEITSDDVTGIGVSQYQDPNTDLSSLILEEITGKKYHTLFEENIYSHLGAEQDAVFILDNQGNSNAAGGFSMTLRDLARYSTIWMNEGIAPDGERVIPIEWIDEIKDQSKGVPYKGYEQYNIRYHNQITSDGTFLAHGGWGGQFMYVDPENKIAYVMFSSLTHPGGGTLEEQNGMYRVGIALSEHLKK